MLIVLLFSLGALLSSGEEGHMASDGIKPPSPDPLPILNLTTFGHKNEYRVT